jgi:anti-sigma regulatory factor (Ser/Thr protein kinase)
MIKTFKAELSSLHPMLSWVRDHLKAIGLSDVEIRRIEVALEEGLVNIISYAYQGEVGTIDISVKYEEGKYVEIIFKDQGLPFNPLKHQKEIDSFIPIEEMEVGGLGILFMQKLMDNVEYMRQDDANILILRKNLS